MKTWSLRWRIAVWSALTTAFALLTFTAVVAFHLYVEQVEMIDVRLETNARVILAEKSGDGRLNTDVLAALATERRFRFDAPLHGYALVRSRGGTVVEAKPKTLAEGAVPWPTQRKRFSRTVDGKRLRFGVFERGETTLLLAARLEPAEESVQDLLGAALIAIPAVLLVVAGGGWWIARRALQPIADITRAAASITADRLNERLPKPATEDEIGAHVYVLNRMFDRLQRSFEQATRFTADAAHELRTPLTILRGQVEDALRTGQFGPAQERLLVGLLEEIGGLQKISDNLLLLARFDTGKNPLHREPLDLSALLDEAHEDAGLLAAPKNLTVVAEIAPAVRVDGDAVMLRRVALNLIDNAVKFNRADGELRLALRTDGGDAVLTVGNTGAGIEPERRAALFQRFYRPNSARDRDSGGTGLGLSLCREIVTAHGGQIELTRAEADWTEFAVRLPRLVS
ncbi:MAG: ATP-binding protein [Opitutaceae bacterium]